jgi:hypothetical protein
MDIFRLARGSRLKYSSFMLNCSCVGVHDDIFASDSEQFSGCHALFRYSLKALLALRAQVHPTWEDCTDGKHAPDLA